MHVFPSSIASSLSRTTSKRKRYSTDSAKSDTLTTAVPKRAELETALEVDLMILEYQAYNATRLLLSISDQAKEEMMAGSQRDIAAFDAFMVTFRHRHPGYRADSMLKSRMLLLQFCNLFCHRFMITDSTPAEAQLETLRQANKIRAREWIGRIERIPTGKYDQDYLHAAFPLSENNLNRNQIRIIANTDLAEELALEASERYGTNDSVSLLDILPLFVQTCEAIHSMRHGDVAMSLKVMIEFMVQACLEQYLVYGSEGFDTIDEAFAWGQKDDEVNLPGQQEEVDLFDESISKVEWQKMKETALSQLCGSGISPTSVLSHFERVAEDRPMHEFELQLRRYLRILFTLLPPPMLVQVEQGRLQGMSAEQSEQLISRCGLG